MQDTTSDIAKAYAESLNRQEELKFFYQRVIHDIKAPIASMISLVKISRERIHDQECQEFFTELESYFRLVESEIFASLKNGAFLGKNKETDPVSFREVIDDVCKLLSHSRPMANIQIHRLVRQNRYFNINRQLIFSIFQNLIHNAIVHGRESDDTCMNIHIKVKQLKRNVLIVVEDDGKGISEKTRNSMVSGFGDDKDLLYRGNGLGLFIIKKAVENLHGVITVEPNSIRGTRFTILIPEAEVHQLQ